MSASAPAPAPAPAPNPLGVADIQAIFDRSPFIGFMGVQALAVDHQAKTFRALMPLRSEVERRPGTRQFHGGPIASFIDVVGDFAIGMLVGGGVPTINLRVDYLAPATGAHLEACATVRRAGRTVAVVDIDVFNPEGKLVAVGRGTYSPIAG